MSTLVIKIDERTLKALVYKHLKDSLGDVPLEAKDIEIQVKSKQNYKAEWEEASFRAIVNRII